MNDTQQAVKVEGWQLISDALIKAGVEYVFGLPGESISPVQRAIEETPIKIITTRHEQAATFMAEAYAKITRKTGVVLVTVGPGFTNTISAMVTAQLYNTPLVLIAGGQGPNAYDKLGLQDMRQEPIIESIVKQSFICRTAQRIPEYIDMAFRCASQGRPGPVFLELPINALDAEVAVETVPVPCTRSKSRPFDKADAKAIIEMIADSTKPVIVAGSGAHYSDAGQEITQLAELTGIPVFTAKAGRGVVSDTHPLCFGNGLGIVPGCAMPAAMEADLVLLLGTRVCLFMANGKLYNPAAKIIQVDIEPEEIGRNKQIDLPVFGDVKALVAECVAQITEDKKNEALKAKFSEWVAHLDTLHESGKAVNLETIPKEGKFIHPGFLANTVNEFMNREDDVVAADGGEAQIWISVARTCLRPSNILDPGLFGCLGTGIPYAIAAKIINPNRRVMVYIGDGSMGFNFMEIETSIRMGLPIVILIDNNRKWGMTSNSMQMRFKHYVPGTVELGNPPYHELVERLGGKGILVEKPDQIVPALEEAFNASVTTCINVMTDPDIIGPGTLAFELLKDL